MSTEQRFRLLRLPGFAGSRSANGAGMAVFFSAAQIIVQSLVLFVTYRIAVMEIGLSSLGLWSVASAAASFGRVGDMGFAGALPRLLAQTLGRSDDVVAQQRNASLIETAVLSSTAGTVMLTALLTWPLMLFAGQVANGADQALVLSLVLGADAALLASALSITFLSCHDGIGNLRYRAFVAITGNLINLAVLWLLIRHWGVLALPISVVVQGTWVALLAWTGLRGRIRGLSRVPKSWSRSAFRELLSIGKFTQTNSLLIVMFEPLSRMLAGRLGGAEFAALFDLAARVAGNVRLLFSSSTQAMVPFYAFVRESADRTQMLFEASSCAIAVLAAAVIAITAIVSPLLSLLALDAIRLDFLAVFWSLLLGNLLSIIGGPSFSYALGAGHAAVTTRAFLLQALTFLVCTFATLPLIEGSAVSVAYGMGLALPGLYLLAVGPNSGVDGPRRLRTTVMRAVSPILILLLVAISGTALPEGSVRSMLPLLVPAVAAVVVIDLVIRFRRSLLQWGRDINGFRIASTSPSAE